MIKVKKQVRWLVFMLTPFVSLLIVLLIIPLEFLLNSFQIQDEANLDLKLNLDQSFTRSLSHQNSQILTQKLQSFQLFIALYVDLLNVPKNRYLVVSSDSFTLNNAFEYSENHPGSNQTEEVSMWFATGISNILELSANQKEQMSSYKQAELFIRAQFKGKQPNGIRGVSICIDNADGDLYFEYPSYSKLEFSSLNSPSHDSYCLETQLNYENLHQQTPYTTFANNDFFRFCGVIDLPNFKAVACLNIDMAAFGNSLYQNLQLDDGLYTQNNFFLLSPHYDDAKGAPTILLYDTKKHLSKYPLGDINLLTPFYGATLKRYLIQNTNSTTFYQIPILIFNQSSQISVNAYLFLESSFIASSIDSTKSSALFLEILIAPIIIIPIVAIVLSLFFLKKTLDNVEDELQKVNDYCKFIVKDDIEIEVPDYEGSRDFQIIYDDLRTINRIHKYTSSSYFKGHFADKILKYNEALSLFKALHYDRGFLMQNIGECYLYIEEFDKSIDFLSQSVEIMLNQINDQFQSFQSIYDKKFSQEKITSGYKRSELILIRRLWKLSFSLFRVLDMSYTITKKIDDDIEDSKEKFQKRERLQEQMHHALSLLKKAVFPNYTQYAEAILTWIGEAKYYISLKNIAKAKENLEKAMGFLQIYTKQYEQNSQKLQRNDKRDKYFRKICKLTNQSRIPPSILNCFVNSYKALIILNSCDSFQRYYHAFCCLVKGISGNFITQSIQYYAISQMIRIIEITGLDLKKIASTQIFQQTMPLRALFLGDICQANPAQLHKFINQTTPGLEREFIFLFDFSKNHLSSNVRRSHQKYLCSLSCFILDKMIKKDDRISIIKCNSDIIFESVCNLILKENHQQILRNQLQLLAKSKLNHHKTNLIYALRKVVARIIRLQSEKIILIALKHVACYLTDLQKLRAKNYKFSENDRSIKRNQTFGFTLGDGHGQTENLQKFGDQLVEIMLDTGLRNCKIVFLCAQNDNVQKVRHFMGLENINRRLWKQEQALNIKSNVVYLIDSKHQEDINRILMVKCAITPDNHVFVL